MSKYNYFNEIAITSTSFSDHVVAWDFVSAGLMLMVDSSTASDIILYSFDGTTVHGNLSPTKANAAMAFDNRHESKVYFARQTGTGSVNVRIEAWG